ncbi:HET-domain-containing protein [Eremomyces bilateralis CBS 781.70]|uniref:HET-domain-containing protein n=1 Tax=Eremomyces bilateralis CBS 781.70 TaxID=1392243 RepID=A0A6G1G095_9PEZI|nr:HET-domain-containing protein [Eremomyces bilateralis CBS 781.70]KAF1811351.1 HET-domain-containing protein [Eremomyces bilateralis CBS 781.70]
MANCPAACSLSLPPPQIHESSTRSTPRTTWDIRSTRPDHEPQSQVRFNVSFERDPSSYSLREIEIDHAGESKLPCTRFCGVCDFCSLVKSFLRGRYGSQMLDWLQSTPVNSSPSPLKVLVELDALAFMRECAGWLIDGRLTKTGDPYILSLRGKMSLIQDDELLQQNTDVVVPLELFAEDGSVAAEYYGIHRRPLDKHALNDRNMEKLRAWLDECDKEHGKCNEPELKEEWDEEMWEDIPMRKFLPTRLLDVGDAHTGRQPKLVVSREHFNEGQDVKYFALSYCWGYEEEERPFMTLRQSFSEHLKSVPYLSLPETFRNVIDLARDLNVQYVWIDSLCIIQNLRRDWRRESAQMRKIFNNAYLTIVAASASSSHGGFLHRDNGPTCTISIEQSDVDAPDPAHYSYSLRHRPGVKWWGSDKMAGISGGRWIKRAWTFQEERLAKRVLIFGESKFFFDCREFERVEDTDYLHLRPDWSETLYGVPESELMQSMISQVSGFSAGSASNRQRQQPGIFDHWQTLCNHYSRRQLTFEDDKLPALSGMASTLGLKVKSEYLAGLWKDHLYHDLFWQTKGTATKVGQYRAPSWSWAALKAEEIQWKYWYRCLDDNCKRYSDILEVDTMIDGIDLYGAVVDGFLKIAGPIVRVMLTWDPIEGMARHPWKVSVDSNEIARADLDLQNEGPGQDDRERTAWALLVARCTGSQSPPRGLVLEETHRPHIQERTLERIGIFRIYPESSPTSKTFLERWEHMPRDKLIII